MEKNELMSMVQDLMNRLKDKDEQIQVMRERIDSLKDRKDRLAYDYWSVVDDVKCISKDLDNERARADKLEAQLKAMTDIGVKAKVVSDIGCYYAPNIPKDLSSMTVTADKVSPTTTNGNVWITGTLTANNLSTAQVKLSDADIRHVAEFMQQGILSQAECEKLIMKPEYKHPTL